MNWLTMRLRTSCGERGWHDSHVGAFDGWAGATPARELLDPEPTKEVTHAKSWMLETCQTARFGSSTLSAEISAKEEEDPLRSCPNGAVHSSPGCNPGNR